MKILVTISALLYILSLPGSLPLSAQNWERMNRKFHRLIEQPDYEKALDYALEMQEFSREDGDTTDIRFTMSSFYIAKAWFGLGDPLSARDYVRLAYAQLVPNIAADENMTEVSLLYGMVETALGYHHSAELLLTDALDMSLELEGQESRLYLRSLYAMADLKMAQANWNEMVGILGLALQIHERNFPPDGEYALYANYMGLIHMNSDQKEEAILYLDKSLSVYAKGYLAEDLSCANVHNNLGLIRYYSSEFEAAEEHFIRAGRLYKKYSEGYSENYMMLLSNLASLYYSWKKEDEARESYRILGEYLENFGERTDLPYIEGLENMAHFHASSGNFEESEAYFLQAIDIRKRMHPPDREAINRTFRALISVCEEFNETRKALKYKSLAEDPFHE